MYILALEPDLDGGLECHALVGCDSNSFGMVRLSGGCLDFISNSYSSLGVGDVLLLRWWAGGRGQVG